MYCVTFFITAGAVFASTAPTKESLDGIYRQAWEAWNRRNYAEAETILTDALKLSPHDEQMQILMVRVLTDQEKWQQAAAVLKQPAIYDPESGALNNQLGWLLSQGGQYADSNIYLERAARLDPANGEIASWICYNHSQLRAFAMAEPYCQKALTLNIPDTVRHYTAFMLTIISKADGKLEKARAYCQDAGIYRADCARRLAETAEATLGTFSPEYRQAYALWSAKRYAEAETLLTQALSQAPEDQNLQMMMGRVLVDQKKWEQGEAFYRRILQSHPDSEESNIWLGWILSQQNKYEEALQYYHHAISLNPGQPKPYYYLCVNYHNIGKHDLALPQCEKAIARNIDKEYREYASFVMSTARLKAGDIPAAEKLCGKAGAYEEDCRGDLEIAQFRASPLGRILTLALPVYGVLLLVAACALMILGRKPQRTEHESTPTAVLAFDGRLGDLFRLVFANMIFSVLTLGIYSFWGKTNLRRYLFRAFTLAGHRFEYTGTARELLRGFLLALPILLGVYLPLMFVGEDRPLLLTALIILGIYFGYVGQYAAWRYRLSRTTWCGIHGQLPAGFAWQYGLRRFALLLGAVASCGLSVPYNTIAHYRLLTRQAQFGDLPFHFDGDPRALFRIHISTLLLVPLTFGLSRFWYRAAATRYAFSMLKVGGIGFHATHTGWGLTRLGIGNLLILLLTLGLGQGFILQRNARYLAMNIVVLGNLEQGVIVQQVDPNPLQRGEGILQLLGGDAGFIG